MPREPLTDAERQLLVVLVSQSWVRLAPDTEMQPEAFELKNILRKLSGADTRVWVEKP